MTKLFGSLLSLLLVGLMIGCTSPTSNKQEPPVPKRVGVLLDPSADFIPRRDDVPWLVNFDWVIGPGRTVEIEAGTEIMFDVSPNDSIGPVWIDVQGRLLARGESTAPILFTTAFVDKDRGQWRGFKLTNTDPAQRSEFRHCVFEYGAYFDVDTLSPRGEDAQLYRGMLSIINSSPLIERCVAYYNQNNAVYISGANARPIIRFNIFTENDASAVRADTLVDLDEIVVSYNNVADNSAIAFLMGNDTSQFGFLSQVNSNLDSCDRFFNIEIPVEFVNAPNGDLRPDSCSPCIDAGPSESPEDNDPDGTRADLGIVPFPRGIGDLRGVLSGNDITFDPAIEYHVICHLRINYGQTLTIPAGTTIDITDVYDIEAFGRIRCLGTEDNPVRFIRRGGVDTWGTLTIHEADSMQRRPAPWTYPSEFHYTEFINYQQMDIQKPGTVFDHCTFDRGFRYGVWVDLPSKRVQDSVSFAFCDFLDCGQYGLKLYESPAGVRNCRFLRSRGTAISVWQSGDRVTISNCIVDSTGGSGIDLEYNAHALVLNNTIVGAGYYGVQCREQSRAVILNNIITNSVRYGLYSSEHSVTTLNYNCLFHNYTEGNRNENIGWPATGDTVFSNFAVYEDPLLTPDFHLGAGSPAINAGDPDPQHNDGDGSRNDLGAFGGPQGSHVGVNHLPRQKYTVAAK